MNYWVVSIIITMLITAAISWIVYSRNRNRPPNRRFVLFAISLTLWSCVVILLMSLKDIIHLLFLIKFIGIIGAFLPAAFIFFAVGFEMPDSKGETRKIKNLQLQFFVFAVIASLFTLHPSFVKKIIISDNLQDRLPGPDVIYGWPFIFHSLIIILEMFFGLRYLYRLMREKTGVQKTEIQYIFLAIITGTIFAVITTLIAPILGTTVLCRFGPMSSIFMCSIIAYAIARHKILNISIFVEKTFVYACLVIGLMLIYALLVLFLSNLVRAFTPQASLFPVIASSFVIAVVFSPLKEIIQTWAKKKIFKRQYDIEKILFQMRLLMGSSLTLEEGLSAMMEIINNEVNINKMPVFLIKSGEESARRIFTDLKKSSAYKVEFDDNSSILKLLATEPYTHFKDELMRFSNRSSISLVLNELQKYDAGLVIPIVFRNKTIGAVLLGGKEDKTGFYSTERSMLNLLSLYLGAFIETVALATTLRENRIHQQSLIDNLPNGVITVDEDHNVIVFNDEAERITGLRKEGVLRKRFEEVIPGDIQELLKELLIHKTRIRHIETEFHRNGNTVPLIASGACFYSSGGSVLGAQLIFSDISELKSLQSQIERNERLASLGILAGGIAHEIRNPLVALKTFSQLLPEKFHDEEFRSNYMKVVIPEIERINKLIEQLLAFAKPGPPRMEKVNLMSIIQTVTILISAQEKFKNINVIVDADIDAIYIMADSEKIKQALLNILLNSAEALDNRSGEIRISIKKESDRVIVEIQDNGQGIKPEYLDKIFDPLFTTKPDGTGLGLTIVNEIIAQHNGRINVESSFGHWTKVFMELPVYSGEFR
ncbi:MAG: ATP-binding protein [Candidatus Omnitrophica bacterium]|nr:ATP-binding protein [Candidatus Omnitrophota bacterium]MCM8828461.1 ATP-binding protein [Candidatus Omnitrophota bacterium]